MHTFKKQNKQYFLCLLSLSQGWYIQACIFRVHLLHSNVTVEYPLKPFKEYKCTLRTTLAS